MLLVVIAALSLVFNQFYIQQLVEQKNVLQQSRKKTEKVKMILTQENNLKKQISSFNKTKSKNKAFLTSNSPSTAASELQNVLKRLIATYSNSRILTMKPFPVVEHKDFSEASLEIRIKDIGHNGLKNVLYRIENHAPVMLVKELDIKRTQYRFKSVVKNQIKKDKLEAVIVVSGFYRELPR